jgi:L-methionine (R)-S-oxide reductase
MYHRNTAHQQWLEAAIASLEAVAGTLHIPRDDYLFLTAAFHIPESVLTYIARVSSGKGMAGMAQTRKSPVQTADLQAGHEGEVPQAGIAVPLINQQGDVTAVIGFAWSRPGELDDLQQQQIQAKVAEFARLL